MGYHGPWPCAGNLLEATHEHFIKLGCVLDAEAAHQYLIATNREYITAEQYNNILLMDPEEFTELLEEFHDNLPDENLLFWASPEGSKPVRLGIHHFDDTNSPSFWDGNDDGTSYLQDGHYYFTFLDDDIRRPTALGQWLIDRNLGPREVAWLEWEV